MAALTRQNARRPIAANRFDTFRMGVHAVNQRLIPSTALLL